jgi:excisionase family DNA binding protein
MKAETDNLLSVSEVAERLGVIRQRVFQFIQSGRLPALMIGSQYVIKESDLSLVADRKTGRPKKADNTADK